MKSGYLVISLDFELLWGVFDKVDFRDRKLYFENTLKIIPKILKIFEENEIHCTWATVGMLFNSNWKEWMQNQPDIIPDYTNEKLSPYKYTKTVQNEKIEMLCFAKDIIKTIQKTKYQEIGTHTYSHYYCREPGQDLGSFRDDLKKAIEIGAKEDINMKSLVFPRNQYNNEYLEVCCESGIENVRSNPSNWYWDDTTKDSLIKKIFRTGDAYIGVNDKSYSLEELKKEKDKPLSQKASRFLRPYSGNKILDGLRLRRIKNEMESAARRKEVYHLWWHPHNFGNNPSENISDLKKIIDHFDYCKNKYDFSSVSMSELNKLV